MRVPGRGRLSRAAVEASVVTAGRGAVADASAAPPRAPGSRRICRRSRRRRGLAAGVMGMDGRAYFEIEKSNVSACISDFDSHFDFARSTF